MAQAGRRVILVDTDLHRPRLHRIFKLPNSAGLTSALLDHDKGTDGLLQETPVEGLRVLTSGQLPPNPAELLGSTRMRELLEQMTGQADIVVLDSPPATALSDSAILATQSDGVLLVLDAGRTRRELAGRALSALQQVKARVVGAVLNRMPVRGPGSYYYYYYYYHYSHYYGSGDGSGENAEKPENGLLKKLRPRRVKTPASA
jgi:capsular exopolysaccharide synthesis family protein